MSDEEIQELKSEIKTLRKIAEETLMSVQGDTKLGIEGLAKRTEKLEQASESFKTWRNKFNLKVAYTSGIVSGATFGGLEVLKAILTPLIHK